MNFLRQCFQKLSSDRNKDIQTDRQDRNYTPRRFAGGHLVYSLPKEGVYDELKQLIAIPLFTVIS